MEMFPYSMIKMRFSLRILLGLTALIALVVAVVVERMHFAKKQADIVAVLAGETLVFYNDEDWSASLYFSGLDYPLVISTHKNQVSQPSVPQLLVDWFGRDFFHSVQAVFISSPGLGESGMFARPEAIDRRKAQEAVFLVSQLKDVQTIHLRCPTGTYFGPLLQLQGLRRVDFSSIVTGEDVEFLQESRISSLGLNAAVDDDAIQKIANIKSLRKLQMPTYCDNESTITNKSIRELAKLPELVELQLNSNFIDDAGCRALAGLTNLNKLCLRLPATDQSIEHVVEQLSLRELRLNEMVIDDKLFEAIGRMENLRILCLSNNRCYENLTESAFMALMKCKTLKVLHLGDISCTDEQYASLSAKLGQSSIQAKRDGFKVLYD